MPHLLDGDALDPGNGGAERHGDVQGDDQEPDKFLGLSGGEAEQSHGESGLREADCAEGCCCAAVEDEREPGTVEDYEVVAVAAEPELVDQEGRQDACCDDYDL